MQDPQTSSFSDSNGRSATTQEQLQQKSGQGIAANYPRTPNECFPGELTSKSSQTGMPLPEVFDGQKIQEQINSLNPIKPFLMIDINACKNKQYTLYEIEQIFAQSGISIVQAYPTHNMTFGDVLLALKQGHKLARTGWNGKGMYIYYVPPVNGIKRIPGEPDAGVRINESMAIYNVDGSTSTWVPSINDCFATDWMVV